MAAALPSEGAGAGGAGGGGGGGNQQPSKRPRLDDLISTLAGQIAPFVDKSHQLNAAIYRCKSDGQQTWAHRIHLVAMFSRYRWQRPGNLGVTERSSGWGNGDSTETTATVGSHSPPWHVTTYAQLTQILEMLPPLDQPLHPEHFLVFWIGGEERSFPVVMNGLFFFIFFSDFLQ